MTSAPERAIHELVTGEENKSSAVSFLHVMLDRINGLPLVGVAILEGQARLVTKTSLTCFL